MKRVFFALFISCMYLGCSRSTATDPSADTTVPRWLTQLAATAIIPDKGMGGLELGDSEARVSALLGKPETRMSPVQWGEGTDKAYTSAYTHKGIFFGIYTDANTGKIVGFRLWDSEFDKA